LLKWPNYKVKDDLLMHFGDKVEVAAIPHKDALDFLDANFERQKKTGDTQ
jgi:hypothetical protein